MHVLEAAPDKAAGNALLFRFLFPAGRLFRLRRFGWCEGDDGCIGLAVLHEDEVGMCGYSAGEKGGDGGEDG